MLYCEFDKKKNVLNLFSQGVESYLDFSNVDLRTIGSNVYEETEMVCYDKLTKVKVSELIDFLSNYFYEFDLEFVRTVIGTFNILRKHCYCLSYRYKKAYKINESLDDLFKICFGTEQNDTLSPACKVRMLYWLDDEEVVKRYYADADEKLKKKLELAVDYYVSDERHDTMLISASNKKTGDYYEFPTILSFCRYLVNRHKIYGFPDYQQLYSLYSGACAALKENRSFYNYNLKVIKDETTETE